MARMKNREPRKPGMDIPTHGKIGAFAMIVDVNSFTPMVSAAEAQGASIAQFVRDTLDCAVQAIQNEGGEVVGVMGDAILGLLPDSDSVVDACHMLANEIDDVCEYISSEQGEPDELWSFCPGGPSIKIAVEYGEMDVSTISSRLLGQQRLIIGSAINYAARISGEGKGKRCVVGPVVERMAFGDLGAEGPFSTLGKTGEGDYQYYFYPMPDLWVEGETGRGEETYLG